MSDSVFTSPSFSAPEARAFELKFLVSAAVGAAVDAAARRFLAPDPHSDSEAGYRTTTLYLDTPTLDIFHRTPGYRRSRYRIRRYGSDPAVWLERKTRRADRVSKRRDSIPETDAGLLAQPLSLDTWPGHWFHQRITARRLGPACLIAYQRTALVGACPEGTMRLTIDRAVRGQLWPAWRPAPFSGGRSVLDGQAILELKFRQALPLPFKRLIDEFRLSPTSVSKYRTCRAALGGATLSASPPSAEVHGA